MTRLLDEIDEERARRLRDELGQRRWIVSWDAAADGPWLARVSGPGHPETIERTGLTRVHAIDLAAEALGRCSSCADRVRPVLLSQTLLAERFSYSLVSPSDDEPLA